MRCSGDDETGAADQDEDERVAKRSLMASLGMNGQDEVSSVYD